MGQFIIRSSFGSCDNHKFSDDQVFYSTHADVGLNVSDIKRSPRMDIAVVCYIEVTAFSQFDLCGFSEKR